MRQSVDPFACHPNLKDKILDPLQSFWRNFDPHEFMESQPQGTMTLDNIYSLEEREANRLNVLSGRFDQDLYVFAYGSLMWDPGFVFSEVRRAYLKNYQRRFILKDTAGARGREEQPGLMAALDVGDYCEGMLFKIAPADIEKESDILWRREMVAPAYKPAFVDVEAQGQHFSALTFVADHSAEMICGDLTWQQQTEYVATGVGFLGSSLDYLTNIARQSESLGIVDKHVDELLAATKDYLATASSK